MISNYKVILCFGHTQTGKSSFIKLNTGIPVECGIFGAGRSTTSNIQAYTDVTKKHPKLKGSYAYIDTIGLGDNTLQYNLKQFNGHIQINLLRISKDVGISSISAIVVTETYFSSSFSLTLIFQQIGDIFGYFPKESIIVIGTKKNMAPGIVADIRKTELLKIMASFSVPSSQFIDFNTPCPELNYSNIPDSQFDDFEAAVGRCKPVVMASIAKKQQAINTRALQIQKQETKQKAIKVKEERVKYRLEKKSKQIQVPKQKRQGGIGGLLGGKKVVWETETIWQDHQVPETYSVEVDKYVPDIPPIQYCNMKAFEEYEKESLKRLGKLIK